MKSQNQRIIDWMLANPVRGITSLEAAYMRPPIMRLSERIRELEVAGAVFLRIDEENEDKGHHTRYNLLSLGHYHPRGEAPEARLAAVQEQYAGGDDPWADDKHDAELARL